MNTQVALVDGDPSDARWRAGKDATQGMIDSLKRTKRPWAETSSGVSIFVFPLTLPRVTRGLIGLGLVTVFLLPFSPTVPAALASKRVITWNLHSKYITKTEALDGLQGPAAQVAGPTGLRSWVVLPNGYTSQRCWPVLYLLHAATVPNEWLLSQTLYQNLPAIVVIPGGGDGQYTNWWNAGARSPGWESWFFDELMPKVTRSFSVCPQRSDHAIAGSSMGGFGAIYLASQRPDYFGTAASFSGVIAISDPVIEYGWGGYQFVWGPPGGFYEVGHDPAYLLPNLDHTRLFVFVGNGTPIAPVSPEKLQGGALVEAVMRQEASLFLAAAHRDQVPVRFEEHDGIHTQDNWNLDLDELIAQNPFGEVATAPTSWRYTTTAQSGVAWNYRYSFAQPPVSLETLTYSKGVLRGAGTGRISLDSSTGRQVTAKMPFVLRDGIVSTGHSGVPVYRPSSLPVALSLPSEYVNRKAALRVTFKTRALPRGETYELAAKQVTGKCTVLSTAPLAERKAGRMVTIKVRPGSIPGHPKNRWCKGGGTVNLTIVPTHQPLLQIGRLVGQVYFVAR